MIRALKCWGTRGCKRRGQASRRARVIRTREARQRCWERGVKLHPRKRPQLARCPWMAWCSWRVSWYPVGGPGRLLAPTGRGHTASPAGDVARGGRGDDARAVSAIYPRLCTWASDTYPRWPTIVRLSVHRHPPRQSLGLSGAPEGSQSAEAATGIPKKRLCNAPCHMSHALNEDRKKSTGRFGAARERKPAGSIPATGCVPRTTSTAV